MIKINLFVALLISISLSAAACEHQPSTGIRSSVKAPTHLNEEACLAAGDKWQPAGMMQNYICIHTYADAGKSCTSSDQCEGNCNAIRNSATVGSCDHDSNPFGCFLTIEDAKAGALALCVD